MDPAQDEARWPALATVPAAKAKAWIARALFRRAIGMVDLAVELPDGRRFGRDSAPLMRLRRPDAFFARLGADGKIGFGESYLAGDWVADDLPGVLTALAAKLTTLVPRPLQKLRAVYDARQPPEEENTITGARSNIRRHYDLSNELFGLFLDETMSYSSAWFEAENEDLAAAQLRKIDGMLDLARVGVGSRMLEIGSGWGALAIRAARERGARVTSLTLSRAQLEVARARAAAAGVADRVDFLLRDYREERGVYDAVVSVEMVEAVGERYWPAYFGALDRLVRPGGRVSLQAITMPHDRMLATRRSYTWMHKYIFPGGLIPSIRSIEASLAVHTRGLWIAERRDLGADYARTLSIWRERFLARRDDVLALGFDEIFMRMWEFYLAYCQAGFAVRYLTVSQLGLARNH